MHATSLKSMKTYKKSVKNFKDNEKKSESKMGDNYEKDIMDSKTIKYNPPGKWYEEVKDLGLRDTCETNIEEVEKLRTQASSIFNEAVILNNAKAPNLLSKADFAWVKTVMSKGTKTDKIAAYTLIIQDSPLYNLSLLKNLIEMVKIGKNKECFMAIDTLCELFLNDLLPPDRKLLSFPEQPLSKIDKITSGNVISRKRRLLLWYFEDQLKSLYGDFVISLNKIAHDTVAANKEKVITVMCKLLEGHPEKENMLLNNIVNKLGDPSHKVGSKVIYALTKLLESHPNMREVVVEAVEKVIFRTNISKRAQYYSVCFLSQFCLFNGDGKLAKQLISIYLSLFKACIKTGDVDSRMMSALLTGVNRAYPFAKEELGMLKEHIDTIYKVIHLSHANIAIQALSLVHLISDYSNAYIARFYSVLYKKVGDIEMFKCSHHAMFLSLIYRAVKKDKERERICAFIKRLLQVSMYIPVPVACGILIMVSEVIKTKKNILPRETLPRENAFVTAEEYSDDGDEHYEDVKEEVPVNENPEEVTEKKPAKVLNAEKTFRAKLAEDSKVWSNSDKSVGSAAEGNIREYDPFVRNPLYSGADKSLPCELFKLSLHFHPTVSLFASKIIKGESIVYSGDPLLDFTLIRFLDKFSFKNPKVIKPEEEKNATFTKFGRRKYYLSSTVRRLRANTADYLNHSEKNIPADEIFLYRYMKEKWQRDPVVKKEDGSDVESVASDEFDEMLSGLADGKKNDINFLSEVGQLPKKKKSKKKEESGSESDFEMDNEDNDEEEENGVNDEGSEGGSLAEDFEGDEVEDFGDDDIEMQGSDLDEADLEASGIKIPDLSHFSKEGKNKLKKKSKGEFKNKLFASAEEFSELLEETGYGDGGSEALSNKDRAGAKQLKWESERDKWIHRKNFRSREIKRNQKNLRNGGKRKRF